VTSSIASGWLGRRLFAAAATAHTARGPKLPSVAAPFIHVDGAVEVGGGVAGGLAGRASVPVVVVDLPQAHIVRSTRVLVHGVSIAIRLLGHDALAVGLVPGVLRAPGRDGLEVGGGTARAGRASAGAVATAGGRRGGSV
jgi:hypothetical protein